MKLKIISPEMVGPGRPHCKTKIFLDNKELEQVTGIDIRMRVDEINRATITFYPTEIEVEGEFEVDENYEK